jgi:hypothetical protein
MSKSHSISATASSGELPKFIDNGTTNNYAAWKTKSINMLETWDLWKYIDGPDSEPPIVPILRQSSVHEGTDENGNKRKFTIEGNKVEYEAKLKEAQPWRIADRLARSKVINAVPDSQVHLVKDAPHAKQAWHNLRAVYQPANSIRVSSIKKSIHSFQCGPDDDVAQWLSEIQWHYTDLCDMNAECMTNREFALLILDNMPNDSNWRNYLSSLWAKVRESDSHEPPLPIHSMDFIVDIRDEYWCRNKDNPPTSTHVFSADSSKGASKRTRSTDAGTADSSKRQRTGGDKVPTCTNPYCPSQRGHSFPNCIAYTGGSQGKYPALWRGCWNIHLPPDQRCQANNVPPVSHPAYSKIVGNAGKSTAYFMHNGALQPDSISHVPSQSRSDTSHSSSTVDDKTVINAALTNETPLNAWNTTLDDEILKVDLPVLEENMPRTDACHHDSGASRHVFHDQTAFETYQAITPVAVKGFGRGLTTAAMGYGSVRVLGRYRDHITPIILTNVLHIPAAHSNLISGLQLARAGVSTLLEGESVRLTSRGINIIGGEACDNMYCLHMTIVHPKGQQLPTLLLRLAPPPLSSRIGPVAATASLDRADFCTASWGT